MGETLMVSYLLSSGSATACDGRSAWGSRPKLAGEGPTALDRTAPVAITGRSGPRPSRSPRHPVPHADCANRGTRLLGPCLRGRSDDRSRADPRDPGEGRPAP